MYTLFADTMLRPTPPAFVEMRNTNILGSVLNPSTRRVPVIKIVQGRKYVHQDPLFREEYRRYIPLAP